MSSQPPSSQPSPPIGSIHLVLFPQETPFFLEIPTAFVGTVCLRPRKYLQYLGWCVLGVIGVLNDEQGNAIPLDGELDDQGVYHYVVPNQNVLAHAIDLEVIKQRSQVSSETAGTRKDFRDFGAKVLERDGRCVWTGLRGVGMYIIPYRRGDEVCSPYYCPGRRSKLLQWLQCIIHNRPHDEELDSLTIGDIRNGIYADNSLHSHLFDPRHAVVLKVCPPVSSERSPLNITSDAESYPRNHRRPREVPAHYSHKCQLPNQVPIYAPMDRYPPRRVYPRSLSEQQ
jgi:hypothetical protein